MRQDLCRVVAAIIGLCAATFSTLSTAKACLPSDLESKLSQIRSNFGPIKVVSTHRPGATIAGSGKPSYHRWCRAVDFNPPPGKYGAVVAWLHANHSGGVGTYSSGHIHIDNGPTVRFSHGWSGGSKTASRGRQTYTSASSSGSERKSSGGKRRSAGRSGGTSSTDSSWMSRIANSQ